jgi:PAS domain S-box-containing protein
MPPKNRRASFPGGGQAGRAEGPAADSPAPATSTRASASPVEDAFFRFAGSLSDMVRSARPDGFGDSCNGRFLDVDDLKRGEAAARAAEVPYRQIVETANEGFWLVDAEQRTAFVNARMAEIVGEMIGRSARDFTFDADRARGDRHWERRRNGEFDRDEFRLKRKDGAAIWTFSSTSPVYDEERRFSGALGMFTDITKRKLAEEALHASEERFRNLASAIPQIVWISRADYREAGASSSGPGASFDAEYRLRDRHGGYRWFLGRGVVVGDESVDPDEIGRLRTLPAGAAP